MSEEDTTFIPLDTAMADRAFDIVLRGYDRAQVDRYVEWAEAQVAEARNAASRDRPNYAELGERVVRILELAEEEASSMRAAAQAAADAIRSDALTATERARGEADSITATATARAEEIMTEAATRSQRATAEALEEAERIRREAREEADRLLYAAREELQLLEGQQDRIREQLSRLREQLAALVSGPAEEATGGPAAGPEDDAG